MVAQDDSAATSIGAPVRARIAAALAPVDAELARRYPGDPGTRQPVHTVYVPADAFGARTVREWGRQALDALDAHAPDAEGAGRRARAAAWGRRRRCTTGCAPSSRASRSRTCASTSRTATGRAPTTRRTPRRWPPPGSSRRPSPTAGRRRTCGIRAKCLEAPVRDRAIRTLDLFLTALLRAGGGALPDGLVLTLPKVTYPEQVSAMAALLGEFERVHGLPAGRLGFEIQIETTQAILGADGRATVARMIDAAGGRATGLHYGTFDYSAACGVSAAHQSMDHPVADHAKAVMQVAAAGTGVRLSDGSTNVLPVGGTAQVHAAWRLHYGLVRRSLARAYYQGWDMHPGHLPTRYAAVYALYREGLDAACARLTAYAGRLGGAGGGAGAVLDEPATARALSGYLLRGLDCGAVDEAEVTDRTGLGRTELDALAGRPPRG